MSEMNSNELLQKLIEKADKLRWKKHETMKNAYEALVGPGSGRFQIWSNTAGMYQLILTDVSYIAWLRWTGPGDTKTDDLRVIWNAAVAQDTSITGKIAEAIRCLEEL